MLTTKEALERTIKVAGEAQREWDAAPEGMRARKILMALAGYARGYRSDIDEIHDVLAGAQVEAGEHPQQHAMPTGPDMQPGA